MHSSPPSLPLLTGSTHWRTLGLGKTLGYLSPDRAFHIHANIHAAEFLWSVRISSKRNGTVLEILEGTGKLLLEISFAYCVSV